MNNSRISIAIIFACMFLFLGTEASFAISKESTIYPENGAMNINPDVQLKITFPKAVVLGNSGEIRIYDASSDKLVDKLDMSIAPGPRNTRTPAPYDTLLYPGIPDVTYTVYEPDTDPSHIYQINFIGGNLDYDACHFYPVLIHDNVATICPHNNHLEYDKTYYVTIDASVFPFDDEIFSGITEKTEWVFTTKSNPPAQDSDYLVVSTDGTGDFNTVQGAFDFIPTNNTMSRTIFVKNGIYEEMVVLKNKHNITVLGEDRDKTIIQYANNGVFNYRRYEFSVLQCNDINLVNFTTISIGKAPAQAEGLCIKGSRNQVHNVTIIGSGDAVQAGGTIFMSESSIKGFGDNVLGYGIFFNECDFISTYGPHLWARNDNNKPGYVLLNCKLWGEEGVHEAPYNKLNITYARAPIKDNYSYPYTEAVLINCAVDNLRPSGFGESTYACEDARCWEYNTFSLVDGSPADYSQRAPYSKQLTMEEDSLTIANYSNPTYVLDGWTPEYDPIIFSKPDTLVIERNKTTTIDVKVAAAPIPDYKWYKDGVLIEGEKGQFLKIDSTKVEHEGNYSIVIKNKLGTDSSQVMTIITKEPSQQVNMLKKTDNHGIKLYPNPTSNRVYVEFLCELKQKIQGSIIDMNGKEVLSFCDLSFGRGKNVKSLDVSSLKSGNYYVMIKSSNKYKSNLLTVIR